MKAWHVAALALVLVVSMVGDAEAYLIRALEASSSRR
jgi:hypothetical protein